MSTSLKREVNGNVVLRNGPIALRFFSQFGGTPLEWWNEASPIPLLTNSFPGSGVSVNWETGQDPTQASANGLTPHPICMFGRPESEQFNYYIRESLFSESSYEVSGFAPDFWLSHESIDDYVTTPDAPWRAGTNVVFVGTASMPHGFFAPGNEMEPGQPRRFLKNRIAVKVRIILNAKKAQAGFVFGKEDALTKTTEELYSRRGYHLTVDQDGYVRLDKCVARDARNRPVFARLGMTRLARAIRKVLKTQGVELELRKSAVDPSVFNVFANGASIISATDFSPYTFGSIFALYANCTSGLITFADRRIFDLNTSFRARYSVSDLEPGFVSAETEIKAIEPIDFYRANLGFFLNPQFTDRHCAVKLGNEWQTVDGQLLRTAEYQDFWTGNTAGNAGLLIKDVSCEVDGAISWGAHALLQRYAINNEFVSMFNPLAMLTKTRCSNIKMKMKIGFSKG